MNKKFMVKMMKAKKLECEAMMEILPQNLIDKIKKMEYEMIDILKEVILDTESDQAHSLSDSFDISLSNQPTMVTTHLYAMEIDVVEESERAYGKLKSYLNKLLTSKTENSIEAEELLVFPGLEELCSLLKVKELYDQGEYDVLIVDCAPTGETLSLLKFPEMLEQFMDFLFPMKRKALKFAGPVIEKTTKIPMPDESHFSEFEVLYQKLYAFFSL